MLSLLQQKLSKVKVKGNFSLNPHLNNLLFKNTFLRSTTDSYKIIEKKGHTRPLLILKFLV